MMANETTKNISKKTESKTLKHEDPKTQAAETTTVQNPAEGGNVPPKDNGTEKNIKEELPAVPLPEENVTTVNQSAAALVQAYWKAPVEKRMYARGDNAYIISSDSNEGLRIRPVDSKCASSHFELVARLQKGKGSKKIAICKPLDAGMIIAAQTFLQGLPKLDRISNTPVLLRNKDNGCRLVTSYDPDEGVLVKTSQYEEVSLAEAKTLIDELLYDYEFASKGDRSRAIAALLTPALATGGFLNGNAPIMMIQADQSQAGKGYFTKLLGAIYSEIPHDVAQKKGPGVGGIDEKFDAAIVRGHNLLVLDNLRGKLKSTNIESFVTAPSYTARTPYNEAVSVKPEKFFIMATSNGVELSKDLANRTCFITIRKKIGHQYRDYEEGSLCDHVKAHSVKYLAAMHAVVKEWVRLGEKRTDEVSHDFRDWCRKLDWIVRNILNEAPLMEGHRAIQIAAERPDVKWLERLYEDIKAAGKADKPLRASEIAECSRPAEFQGVSNVSWDDLDPEAKRSMAMSIGLKLARLMDDFVQDGPLNMGKYTLIRSKEREKFPSGNSTNVIRYTFKINA